MTPKCPTCGSEKVTVRYIYGTVPHQDALRYTCEACTFSWHDKTPYDHEPVRYNSYFNLND